MWDWIVERPRDAAAAAQALAKFKVLRFGSSTVARCPGSARRSSRSAGVPMRAVATRSRRRRCHAERAERWRYHLGLAEIGRIESELACYLTTPEGAFAAYCAERDRDRPSLGTSDLASGASDRGV